MSEEGKLLPSGFITVGVEAINLQLGEPEIQEDTDQNETVFNQMDTLQAT
jgi:hypothetical protein